MTDTRTNDELNILIAQWTGDDDRYMLQKRGLYYRPNGNGYTSNPAEAWVMSYEEAREHEYDPRGGMEPVLMVGAPIPNYCSSVEEVFKVIARLDHNNLFAYAGEIGKLADDGVCWTTRTLAVSEASARKRCEALARVIESPTPHA